MNAGRDRVVALMRQVIGDPAPRGRQTKIAKAVGVTAPTVSRWKTSMPDPKLWTAIEDAIEELTPGAIKRAYDGEVTPPRDNGHSRQIEMASEAAKILRLIEALDRRVAALETRDAQRRRGARG